MKFETNYSRARTIRGRELIQGRGSRCANYSRARTNRGRELFGLLGYIKSLIGDRRVHLNNLNNNKENNVFKDGIGV